MATDENTPTNSNSSETSKSENPQAPTADSSNPQQRQGQSQSQSQDRRRNHGGDWKRNQNRDVLYEKAVKLAQSGRVEFLDNGVYNVIGDHGTYTVALDHTGKLSCNCPGFIQKGKCSHIMAVSLVAKNRRRR